MNNSNKGTFPIVGGTDKRGLSTKSKKAAPKFGDFMKSGLATPSPLALKRAL